MRTDTQGAGLKVGDEVPRLELPLADGGTLALGGPSTHIHVLYFYPKDDTPGCTSQAKAFSYLNSAFSAANAKVIGISRDDSASHRRFAAKHGLTIALASDPDGKACEAFGVWVEKSLYGKRFMGIERSTFVIGTDGRVATVWRRVKVAGHAEAVLGALAGQTTAH
jgi:peroxiredoxin Q/BCP